MVCPQHSYTGNVSLFFYNSSHFLLEALAYWRGWKPDLSQFGISSFESRKGTGRGGEEVGGGLCVSKEWVRGRYSPGPQCYLLTQVSSEMSIIQCGPQSLIYTICDWDVFIPVCLVLSGMVALSLSIHVTCRSMGIILLLTALQGY